MSVNSYLQDLGSELVLNSAEKNSISISIDSLKSRLSSYFGNDIKDKKLYGSYVRETILPRKVDENSDVDLMVVFNNPYEYKPQSFLNRLKEFAEHYYTRSEIYQSSPTIVLELNHIKFEITPSYIKSNLYYIPMNSSQWMQTDPDGFYSSLTECNKINNYKVKPVIRLLKYWNINKNNRDIESFELEKTLAKGLMFAFFNCTSYTDYLKYAFNTINFSANNDRINNALNCIEEAMRLEREGYPNSAGNEIKKLFPEV